MAAGGLYQEAAPGLQALVDPPRGSSAVQQDVERAGGAEVGEGPRGAVLGKRLGGEATRSDADALGTHRAGGVHVLGRVSADHHPARRERVAQRPRTALGAATDERRAILGITAEASEGEAVVQSDRLE